VYFRSDLVAMLTKEFDADDQMAGDAVDSFVKEVAAGKYEPSTMLADVEGGEDVIEGDIEVDAEYVYDTQRYWDLSEAPVTAVGLEDVPLADWEEKLLREDGEL
jgi:hypothetical protein